MGYGGSGGPGTNYAAAAESLSLSLGAPGAPSFFIGAVGGDSTAAGQTFAPSGWAALHTMSQSNGSNQLASNYLTSAFLSILLRAERLRVLPRATPISRVSCSACT